MLRIVGRPAHRKTAVCIITIRPIRKQTKITLCFFLIELIELLLEKNAEVTPECVKNTLFSPGAHEDAALLVMQHNDFMKQISPSAGNAA